METCTSANITKESIVESDGFVEEISTELLSQLDDLDNVVRASNQSLDKNKKQDPLTIIVDESESQIANNRNTPGVLQVAISQEIETKVENSQNDEDGESIVSHEMENNLECLPKAEDIAASSTVNIITESLTSSDSVNTAASVITSKVEFESSDTTGKCYSARKTSMLNSACLDCLHTVKGETRGTCGKCVAASLSYALIVCFPICMCRWW